jgi:hypothetical protein
MEQKSRLRQEPEFQAGTGPGTGIPVLMSRNRNLPVSGNSGSSYMNRNCGAGIPVRTGISTGTKIFLFVDLLYIFLYENICNIQFLFN